MNRIDQLQRFVFEHTPIRGNLVHLDQTVQHALQHHEYPAVLRRTISELMAAGALLAATLKMQGALVLQIQGSGPLKLLVVECNADLSMRATAKWTEALPDDADFRSLIGNGHFVITLDPKDGSQSYQGIVPLEGDSVSTMLEHYMQRSEQIDTRIWLTADTQSAAGMLLQKLPDQPEQDLDAWQRVTVLADSATATELLTLPATTLLHRLFHQETVRLFDAQAVSFQCSCSRDSVGDMLRMLGQDEIASILSEQERIEIHCDFCNARYEFDAVDAGQLFLPKGVIASSSGLH